MTLAMEMDKKWNEGKIEGQKEERLNNAISMLKHNVSIDIIADVTKYTKDKIIEIAKQNALL